jgi:Ca2+-transporting ATPase
VVLEAFMDVAGSATFVAEPPEADVMARPPRDPHARFLDRAVTTAIFSGGASLFAAVAGVYLVATWTGAPTVHAQTLAFTTWMVGYLALAWAMRSERTPLARLGWGSNRFLPAWTVVTAAALMLIMTVPDLRTVLRLTTLSVTEWSVVIVVPLVAVAWLEINKIISARRRGGVVASAA